MKIDRYSELVKLVETFEQDFKKFYNKENREAGIRLRKHMQELREFALKIRDEVQECRSEFVPKIERKKKD